MPRKGSGRNTVGRGEFERSLALVLAVTGGICGLCGHPGARTGDHIVPYSRWPRDRFGRPLPGIHDVTNVQPAHGTIGNVGVNRCDTCHRVCNQSKGNRELTGQPRSRDW